MTTPVPLRMRPLEIGDLLDETFRMYRRHFLLFAGISVILAIPSAALIGLVFASLSSVVGETGQTDFAAFTPFLESLGAAVIVSLVILPFTQGAVMYAACESALGRPVTAGGVFMGVLRRYFPLLGYWLLFALTGYLAAALCLVPLVLWAWVFVLWSVATPAMFVENIGLGAAMSRSRYLVQGRWWRTFLVLLLMVVVWYLSRVALGAFLQLGQVLLTIVLSPFIVSAIALAGSQLVGALVTPVLQITIVLIYFDLRVRREALDLFQMAYRIASPAATS
jgi:hypothetical protein